MVAVSKTGVLHTREEEAASQPGQGVDKPSISTKTPSGTPLVRARSPIHATLDLARSETIQ